jgi:hypothetical protein
MKITSVLFVASRLFLKHLVDYVIIVENTSKILYLFIAAFRKKYSLNNPIDISINHFLVFINKH